MGTDAANLPLQQVGQYELIEKIAEGGMGGVFKGKHQITGEIVAVKVMTSNMTKNDVLLKRFEQEHRAANRLNHPNIVRSIEFGTCDGLPYLVMEYVDGESLGSRLERDRKLPVGQAIRMISQVAQGLHRAHKEGLIHRDVKPDNILINQEGAAKLADLGLVKEVDTDLNLTKTGRGLGTPHFMAPEQFRNAKNADVRCDVYSLGATLYVMVTGQLPFRSTGPLDAWMKKVNNDLTAPRELVPDIPERVEWAILRAMSADPEKRPASCREFVEDLTGHSTRRAPALGKEAGQELWYLVYRDEEGVMHTVKGNKGAIRRSLKEGLLGDASNVRAARSKGGPFELLQTYPEFRDLLISAGPVDPAGEPSEAKKATPARTKKTPETTPVVVDVETEAEQAPTSNRYPPPPWEQNPSQPDTTVGGNAWVKWVIVILLVAGSAALSFFLFTLLKDS